MFLQVRCAALGFHWLQMPLSGQRGEIDIDHTPHFDVIQRQLSHQVDGSGLAGKIALTVITGSRVQSEAQFGTTLGVSELNMHIAALDTLLEALHRFVGPEACFHGMRARTQTIHEVVARAARGGKRLARRHFWRPWGGALGRRLHLFAQAQRAHVRPYGRGVVPAYPLQTACAYLPPTQWIITVCWPDPVLFLVAY